jgi:Flp pilus assembly protein TadD
MNRGAVLIAENRPEEAIAALDRSLELGTPEPERALYDRALARERLGDVTGAYYDLLKAAQLNPNWDVPAKELTYFKVTRKQGPPAQPNVGPARTLQSAEEQRDK